MMNRNNAIKRLQQETFDLLVIGGGITGAGIALDAASRGLNVALVEKRDFGSGTSSRSTKLIHGGLRYLKQFEFKLVNEVGRERAIVHRIAPHLVHPDKMLLPLITNGNYGYWLTNIGLTVYDFLAGVEGDDRRRMLNREETLACEPLLRSDIVEGGGLYAEYRTDDARLVMAVIKTAAHHHAAVANYMSVNELQTKNQRVVGALVEDTLSGGTFAINARVVVNSTGPWVDDLRRMAGEDLKKRLMLTKGVHLVVPHERLPIRQTVYFDHCDGRMIFAVPRGGVTYLGTTDTAYDGDRNEPAVLPEDVHYILEAVNAMFPSVFLSTNDVESSWAGLRPLIHEAGKNPSEVSRKDEIFTAPNGLISIAGGKLTGYRKMAERVVDRVCHQLASDAVCITERITLHGGNFDTYADLVAFKEVLKDQHSVLFNERIDASYLVNNYGRDAASIAERAAEFTSNDIPALLYAELIYAIENEMCCTALDFWERRTGRLNFNIATVRQYARDTIQAMALKLHWDSARCAAEMYTVQSAIARVSGEGSWKPSAQA